MSEELRFKDISLINNNSLFKISNKKIKKLLLTNENIINNSNRKINLKNEDFSSSENEEDLSDLENLTRLSLENKKSSSIQKKWINIKLNNIYFKNSSNKINNSTTKNEFKIMDSNDPNFHLDNIKNQMETDKVYNEIKYRSIKYKDILEKLHVTKLNQITLNKQENSIDIFRNILKPTEKYELTEKLNEKIFNKEKNKNIKKKIVTMDDYSDDSFDYSFINIVN